MDSGFFLADPSCISQDQGKEKEGTKEASHGALLCLSVLQYLYRDGLFPNKKLKDGG